MLGPLATPAQHSNADLAGSLYHLWLPLHRALPEHSESVRSILKPSVEVRCFSFFRVELVADQFVVGNKNSLFSHFEPVDNGY